MLKYFQSKIVAIFLLGCVCGIPTALTISTLNSWLAIAGINKTMIGFLSIVSLPYAVKFLWSPIIDYIRIPFLYQRLGNRRSWLLIVQLFLFCTIIKLGLSDPIIDIYGLVVWAIIVSIFGATQEMIIEAYRIEILRKEEQGMGSAAFVFGVRIGVVLVSGGTLLLVDVLCKDWHICENFAQWSIAYMIFATLVFIGIITTIFAGESHMHHEQQKIVYNKKILVYFSEVMRVCIITPLFEITKKHQWYLVLIFIVTYRLCDAFIASMLNPFFLDVGFSLSEVALVSKTFGFIATTIGSIVGGAIAYRYGVMRSLLIAGLAQMLSNSMFILQAKIGYNITFLYLSVAAESIGGGMATTVFITYLSSLCMHSKHTATQYALLTSLVSIDEIFSSVIAGWVTDTFGWVSLFTTSVVLGIPPLIILHYLNAPNQGDEE